MYPLKDLLKVSGLARSTFYCYLKTKDIDKYKEVKNDILEIFNQNKGRYGYRRILFVLTFYCYLKTKDIDKYKEVKYE